MTGLDRVEQWEKLGSWAFGQTEIEPRGGEKMRWPDGTGPKKEDAFQARKRNLPTSPARRKDVQKDLSA